MNFSDVFLSHLRLYCIVIVMTEGFWGCVIVFIRQLLENKNVKIKKSHIFIKILFYLAKFIRCLFSFLIFDIEYQYKTAFII